MQHGKQFVCNRGDCNVTALQLPVAITTGMLAVGVQCYFAITMQMEFSSSDYNQDRSYT